MTEEGPDMFRSGDPLVADQASKTRSGIAISHRQVHGIISPLI